MSSPHLMKAFLFVFLLCFCPPLPAQTTKPGPKGLSAHLQVEAGTPLRLYVTQRIRYREGDPVQAKVADSVWAFDRVVIPVGTVVMGQVVQLEPVPKLFRAMAIVRGDFTPLKQARVSFTRIVLPDGKTVPLDTGPSLGLASIYTPPRPPKNKKPQSQRDPNTKAAQFRSLLKQQAQAQANARTRGMLDLVRTPNKREWLEDFFWAKLPYHPQWYRTGTRFDAILEKPLEFGNVAVAAKSVGEPANNPIPDTPVQVRFLSSISSKDARVGDPVASVLSQPLFSPDRALILPEGTRLTGKVTQSRPARFFHRGGQLRFVFDRVEVPAFASAPARAQATQAQLSAAEETSGRLQIDSEGTAKATESKARFLRPLIAGLIAAKSMDNDTGKQTASGGANANYSGATLGGFSGFGLFGMALAQGPRPIGTALGFYGLGWSVYTTIVSRGRDVTFDKQSAMAIRFAAPPDRFPPRAAR
jgi:hypothetical protein